MKEPDITSELDGNSDFNRRMTNELQKSFVKGYSHGQASMIVTFLVISVLAGIGFIILRSMNSAVNP